AHFQQTHAIMTTLAEQMSVAPQDLVAAVGHQSDDLKSAQKDAGELRLELLGFEAQNMAAQAESVASYRLVKGRFENRPVEELQSLAKEFLPMSGVIALLAGRTGKKFTLVVACSDRVDVPARGILQAHLSGLRGGGGGGDRLAQGGGTITAQQFEGFFDRSDEIIKSLL
ncbi:MAG: DHHA1 domain-containing protein, partial [Chloroflexota bacterium]|nr:DHHA1 domain-containing protein [Chloroflexota bacterium]